MMLIKGKNVLSIVFLLIIIVNLILFAMRKISATIFWIVIAIVYIYVKYFMKK